MLSTHSCHSPTPPAVEVGSSSSPCERSPRQALAGKRQWHPPQRVEVPKSELRTLNSTRTRLQTTQVPEPPKPRRAEVGPRALRPCF